MHHELEKNLKILFSIRFFNMFLVLMPVIVPFFMSLGIGMEGVYLLQSVFAATVFICEIPSGYLSDMLGRKNTLIASSLLKGVGFSLFAFADGIELLIVAEVILGICISLYSGTDTAILYDTLDAVSPGKAHIKIFGKYVSMNSFGEALAALSASILMLLLVKMKTLVILTGLFSWIPLFLSLFLIEPPRKKMQQKHSENFKYMFEKLFRQTRLLNLIIVNSIFSFLGTLIAVWMFQKYWDDLGIPLVYFGFLWALTNFMVTLISRQAHKFEKIWGSANLLAFIGMLPILGYIGISLIDHTLGFLVCLLFQVDRGLGQVLFTDALNRRVTSDFRASANSIVQMGVRVLYMVGGPIFGLLIDERGTSYATAWMGGIYFFVFIFAMIPLLKERRNFITIKK